ncbi:3 TM domain-containing transmembrane protein [Acrasis kona]|uniref:3 TM domain-containing transmembrane protein n=1 Tax=Acrasis kona TaxID=1008807 RepID=A0AAW2ZBZ3_9EUKA
MQESQNPDAYIYTSESNVDQSVVAQYHFARKYSISILLPGLFIILATSIVVMIAMAASIVVLVTSTMVAKDFLYEGDRANSTMYLKSTNEYQALLVSSPLFILFYLLHLLAAIIGIFLSPDYRALDNYAPDDIICTTKQNMIKYSIFALFLPVIVTVLFIIVLLIVFLAYHDKKIDCCDDHDDKDDNLCCCCPTAGNSSQNVDEVQEQGPAPYQQMSLEKDV